MKPSYCKTQRMPLQFVDTESAISPVHYVPEYIFVQNFWRFGNLYIFGKLRTY